MDKDNGTTGFMNASQNRREVADRLLGMIKSHFLGTFDEIDNLDEEDMLSIIAFVDMAREQPESEAMAPSELLDQWWDRLGTDGAIRSITREQLAEAMRDAIILAMPSGEPDPAEPPVPLPAFAHEIKCMGDRAEEAGMMGNALIAHRAAAFVGYAEKLVTRLLPDGHPVHHAIYGELTARSPVMRQNGSLDLMCDRPGGGWHQLPVAELVPIYEIRPYANGGLVENYKPTLVGEKAHSCIGPISHVRIGGEDIPLDGAAKINSLEASDRPATIHAPICRHNPGDDEFPSG